MNKWVKSLTAVALASSLFMVGCSKGEEKKDEETTQQEDTSKDKETSGEVKDNDSKDSKDSSSSSSEKK
ncbi:hypothetical protein BACCIP111899_03506 [Bacillus rhizoplanae]|uniref:Lipoprotein n=1 Tax=Bacillus rhizoplanae TaxID=2880966 RepID=A0ABM8YEN1_9BACI|nr:hypothetical protein [Bacillus rhizoplanae]CAG9614279.1 hypothetical protein BACCIP111899_03506 [Bacillus rhizoplanae]